MEVICRAAFGARRAAAVIAGALAAACVAPPADDMNGAAPEFVDLLDGGVGRWMLVNAEPESFAYADGVLRVTGDEGWLRSNALYADFRLRVEFRFLSDDTDSGVYVRAAPDGGVFIRGWPNESYQVQLRNPLGESRFPPLGGLFRHGMPEGALDYDPADAERLSAGTGVWQTLEIDAVGETLSVRLNGEALMEAEDILNACGHIGVQSETGALEIRSMVIEEIAARE